MFSLKGERIRIIKQKAKVARMVNNKQGCIYCIATDFNDAWLSQPEIDPKRNSSNLNGTLPIDDPKRHEGVSVKIKDYGHLINVTEEDPGFIEHVNEHPGSLEIRSDVIGKKLFPEFNNCPLIIEIEINYCPICGRKLGIIPREI